MSNDTIVKSMIGFIEENLHKDLSLDHLSKVAGYSKYHFLRLFQAEVGVTASEYIRYRRIANAAKKLIYSNDTILEIALFYRFETQESFTRSFKRTYNLPPGQYRKIMSSIHHQQEEIALKNEQMLKGWFLSGSHPFHYKMGVDRETFHKGWASGYLKAVTAHKAEEFATMMQQFKAQNYLGKRLKLSGFIKSSEVDAYCGFWMRVDDNLRDILQFDNMSDRPITGNTDWNHYSIVLDIPDTSSTISFGVLLVGSGQVWIDELKFVQVDENTPTTNIEFASQLLEEPTNLSFEE
ncbi:MAG: AraC family transcriptional regulator [Bacillota bacterium]|nr:AraC family transcriptional regulator [Bacillota bacterium]